MTTNETPSNEITPKQTRMTIGCLGLAIIAGAALTIFGVFFLLEGNESNSWPTAEGDVKSVYVRTHRSDNGGRSYTYEVTYDYVVNDQIYTSDRYSLGDGSTASKRFNNENEARANSREEYPVGSIVMVSYNPNDPQSAVLNPGANFGTYMPLVLGLAFILGGIVMIILVIRNNQSRKASSGHSDL